MIHSVIVDWSKWQGNTNPTVAVQNGAEGFIIRAGAGNLSAGAPYEDYQFASNSVKCPEVADTGAYWYLRLHKKWIEQIQFFINLLKASKPKPFLIRPTLDVEEYKDENGNPIPIPWIQARLKTCLDMLENEFKVKPIIYTRTSIWNPGFGNPSWAKDYPLWVARYVYAKDAPDNVLEICDNLVPYTNTVPLPYPWQPDNYTLWQCTADDNKLGAKYGVPLPPYGTLATDLNLTKGNMADFRLKAGMVQQPPPIPPGDEMLYCKVTLPAGQTQRNMRSLPDSVYPGQGIDVGDVYPSDTSGDKKLPVLKIHTNSEGTWYLVLKEAENMKVGWVLAIVGTVNYLTLV